MKEKLIKIFDYVEYGIIGVSMFGMLIATFGMLFFYHDIKQENIELKARQEIAINKCIQNNKKCEAVK